MRMICQLHIPAAVSPCKISVAPRIEGCVSPRAEIDVLGKKNSLSPRGIETYDRSTHSLVIIPTQ
jgi:hypothetical protein